MSHDEDALRAAVETATGRPLEPVPYFRMTDEQRKRHDEAQFRHVGPDPCAQCHPELHRSQCWEGGCVAASRSVFAPVGGVDPFAEDDEQQAWEDERERKLLARYERSIVELTLTLKRVKDLIDPEHEQIVDDGYGPSIRVEDIHAALEQS